MTLQDGAAPFFRILLEAEGAVAVYRDAEELTGALDASPIGVLIRSTRRGR